MEKQRKLLKEYSVVILIFVAISLVKMIVELCLYGFSLSGLGVEGIDEQLVKIVSVIVFVIALLFLIPDFYVGVKGIKEANAPTGARAHIVWSLILAILYTIGTVSSAIDLVNGVNLDKVLDALNVALDAIVFFGYYFVAKKVANAK